MVRRRCRIGASHGRSLVGFSLVMGLLAWASAAQARPAAGTEVRSAASGRSAAERPHARLASTKAALLTGDPSSPAISSREWRQIVFELRASGRGAWPSASMLEMGEREARAIGVQEIAWLDVPRAQLEPSGAPRSDARVVAACAMPASTYRGGDVRFRVDRRWLLTEIVPEVVAIDPGDGGGWRTVSLGQVVTAHYAAAGPVTVRVRVRDATGLERTAALAFEVRALGSPTPDDTLAVTATIPYAGGVASGDAYVYLAPGHGALANPAVVVEGFDLDNSMFADELYDLLNREQLLERLRTLGYDAVVLNFDDATTYLQRNAYLVVELLQVVKAAIPPGSDVALAGASMGGLVSRYALAYMETHGLSPNVRTFISFDGPQRGANIPLGIQYWLAFFSDDSADAAALLAALDSPAARQMLVYHHTNPPGGTGSPDALRTTFLADLAAAGDFPTLPRTVSVANGSGSGQNQGFVAGAQIIRWQYSDFFIDIVGDVWAVPDASSRMIFHGVVDPLFFPRDEQSVTVSGTDPYDSAPGGSRASMAQMDAVSAPFGDIVALHDAHCFIPTTSALDLDVDDLFYDVAGDVDLLAHTPFDAVYFPDTNQEHVLVTAENAEWLIAEITGAIVAVPDGPPGTSFARLAASPNPFRGSVVLRVAPAGLGNAEAVRIYDVAGRVLAWLRPEVEQGVGRVTWNGLTAEGRPVQPGVYYVQWGNGADVVTARIVRR